MSVTPRNRDRPMNTQAGPSPESELTALLWVTAGLIAMLELAWWMFDRMYS